MINLRHLRILTSCLLGITLIVIALGGLIRIYDAGESCPDWPTCFGTWGFDVSEEEQEEWWNENPDEIDSRGSGHRYSKFQIFTEWIHRFLAGFILGPLVLTNWYLIRRQKDVSPSLRLISTVNVILIVWQGAIGWLTVKMDNLHWSVGIHLSSALAFTMSLIWLWLKISNEEGSAPRWIVFENESSSRWLKWIGFLSIGSFFSIFSGTFVSTTPGANFGCGVDGMPDSWPLCGGKIVDSIEDWVAQSQMIHRWFVGTMLFVFISVSYLVKNEDRVLRNWVWSSTALFSANTLIGATYVLSWDMEEGFFEYLSLVHLMLASITFLTIATAWLGCVTARKEGY